MRINRSWMVLTLGEKIAVLEYAVWVTDQRWGIQPNVMKKATMAGS